MKRFLKQCVKASLLCMVVVMCDGCTPTQPNELDKLGTVDMTIGGKKFRLWIADEYEEQQRGLMFITADKMTPLPDGTERGMIFVFKYDGYQSFWMKNTVTPLDIAYVRSSGKVVDVLTMKPLDMNQYPSSGPARFAIEVNAGVFTSLPLKPDDQIEIPDSLKN